MFECCDVLGGEAAVANWGSLLAICAAVPDAYAALGGNNPLCCSPQSLGNEVRSSSCSPFDCRPLRIVSTTSGGSSVNRSSRLTKLRVTPSASAISAADRYLPPTLFPSQRADQRVVRPRFRRRPRSPPSGAMITLRPPRRFQVIGRSSTTSCGRSGTTRGSTMRSTVPRSAARTYSRRRSPQTIPSGCSKRRRAPKSIIRGVSMLRTMAGSLSLAFTFLMTPLSQPAGIWHKS